VCSFCILLLLGCGDGWYLQSPISNEPPIVLHPMMPADIFSVPKGSQVEWSDMEGVAGDLIFVEKQGWFVSDYYMEEIMKAKVGQ